MDEEQPLRADRRLITLSGMLAAKWGDVDEEQPLRADPRLITLSGMLAAKWGALALDPGLIPR